jgi:nicotinamide mononucleotide transporter
MQNWLEASGVVTTILGIWLTTRRKMLCWPITLIADIIYLIVFYQARLYSDTLLQIFFIGFTLYGWWYWHRGLAAEGSIRVITLPKRALLLIPATALIALAWGLLMLKLNAALPFLDAQLMCFSLLASWWQARKNTINWPLWVVVNLIYIGEYLYKGLLLTSPLYAILAILALIGWRDWHRAEQVQNQ